MKNLQAKWNIILLLILVTPDHVYYIFFPPITCILLNASSHLYAEVALELIEHLRAMGETNALLQRSNVCFPLGQTPLLPRKELKNVIKRSHFNAVCI